MGTDGSGADLIPATASAQKTAETVRSFGTNDAGPGSRGRVSTDSQQLSARCAGPAIAMPIIPIYARQVLPHRDQISRSMATMNGEVESCSNNQDE
jgi:hypothetical protein